MRSWTQDIFATHQGYAHLEVGGYAKVCHIFQLLNITEKGWLHREKTPF